MFGAGSVCTALGGNISTDATLFESALNIGWEGSATSAPLDGAAGDMHASLAYLATLE